MSESVKNYEFNYEYIRAVAPAVSKEEARYYLNGVYIYDDEDGRHYVATDGHVLFHILDEHPTGEKLSEGMIIKSKFKNFKGSDFLNFATVIDNKTVVFGSGEDLEIGSIVDGTFPNFWAVIPKKRKMAEKFIAYNPKYLQKVVEFVEAVFVPEVNLKDEQNSPSVWVRNGRTAVLMPMRV